MLPASAGPATTGQSDRPSGIQVDGRVVLDCSPGAQPLESWRVLRALYANHLRGAPSELASRDCYADNALLRIRAWQKDLVAGEALYSTVKVFVVGNSRVGKTQICRRLLGKTFDPTVGLTHAISLGRVLLADDSKDQPALDASIWDFGGQDIYLGTHALFLDKRAIYVIAWAPGYENTKDTEERGMPLRNHPLGYWLEYVRSLAGPQAPVIVVQTQCDREIEVKQPPISSEHGFERLRITSSSAKQRDGLERLQLELKGAARYQAER
jgi:internalin A